MAHTPGPWRIRRGGVSGTARAVDPIINWNGLKRSGCDYEANANLIAAAPELLEALFAIVSAAELHGTNGPEFFEAREQALVAIAKAEGE